jgi:hypothetical protein
MSSRIETFGRLLKGAINAFVHDAAGQVCEAHLIQPGAVFTAPRT